MPNKRCAKCNSEYVKEWSQNCVWCNNIKELLEEPQENLKWQVNYVWFCTIFLKKKNKPLMTFDTLEGFTEEHGKAIALMKGAMGSLDKETFKIFREFVNQTGKLDKETKFLVSQFDKKFRVLVSTD